MANQKNMTAMWLAFLQSQQMLVFLKTTFKSLTLLQAKKTQIVRFFLI